MVTPSGVQIPDPPQLAGPLLKLAGIGPASRGSPRLQFGLQLYSSLAPQRLAHPLARVPHLERGHVGVALGCRHPGVAKYLLDDADVHALLDQQRRSGMPGIMNPGIPNPGLPEDRLPGPPVLGTLDRTAMPRGEYQIMILPGVACLQPLSCLPLSVLLEQIQDRTRAL